MRKICFLFGAGAEGPGTYGIGEGKSFRASLLSSEQDKELTSLIGEKTQYKLLHYNSKKIYFQTIAQNVDEAKKVFGNELVDICLKKHLESELTQEEKSSIAKKPSEWFKQLTDNKCKNPEKIFFLNNAVFFDSLDEKFNRLRMPEKDNAAKRVINSYVTIFILILKQLYAKELTNFTWNYENIFSLLEKEYCIDFLIESYYSILREATFPFDIITTNYTDIVSKVLTPTNSKLQNTITFLHGKLHWFEDYHNLRVYDSLKNKAQLIENVDHIIPFILIPSGVKPLICTMQIEQFADFVNKLKSSNMLCVVGYRFNSEDNHINAIINEWLRDDSNRKLIYLNFKEDVKWDTLLWVDKETQMSSDIDNIEKALATPKQIINIDINEESSLEIFSKLINFFSINDLNYTL